MHVDLIRILKYSLVNIKIHLHIFTYVEPKKLCQYTQTYACMHSCTYTDIFMVLYI